MAELAKSFRDLRVYRAARTAAQKIFVISRRFPREETCSLTDQIRRPSRSTKNQIPEAWARRRYPAAFISKFSDAMGEAMESQSWLDDAFDCGYINEQEHFQLAADYQSIGAMLNSMVQRADEFVPVAIRNPKTRG